MAIETLGGG